MTPVSPFLQDRFEYERRHLYYLPGPLYQRVEQAKPAYLVGSRGTGKTTLLMALNWEERLRNEWLRGQLGDDPFANHCVGVYLKLPEYKLETLEEWLAEESDDRHGLIVGLYLDLLTLEVLIDGIAGLISAAVIRATPDDEANCVDRIFSDTDARSLKLDARVNKAGSLRQLRSLFAAHRESLERHAGRRSPLDSVLPLIPAAQIGTLGKNVAKQLAALCDTRIEQSDHRWYFKACLDEGETLTARQQVVLNTAVRLSAWPLFPVAAFVREPIEGTRTLAQGLTLASTDRDLILLDGDDTDDQTFRTLAEGVASVRLRAYLQSADQTFDVRSIFGNLDINGLLEAMLRQSVSKEGRELLRRAEENGSKPFFQEHGKPRGSRRGVDPIAPPIYQTYLIDRLKLELPEPHTPAWQRRAQDSAELRKKFVAAYLSICRELKLEVRYASADMILQISDKRIRDFLSFVHAIHSESKVPAAELGESRIPSDVQHSAILQASRRKLTNLRSSGVAAPTPTSRLIEALGHITRIVQTEGPGNRHLVATERGLFRIEIGEKDRANYGDVLSLIREAAEAGYLHLSKAQGRTWKFRVHASLAPAFSLSYRGAYYDTPISLKDLARICGMADQDERERTVSSLGARLSGDDSGTQPLFGAEPW